MADYSQLMNLEKKGKTLPPPLAQKDTQNIPVPSEQQKPAFSSSQSTNQSSDQPTNQSTDQSVSQSTSRSTIQLLNQIVDKPKAFYITKRLDHRLDDAVRYIQEQHGIKKVDRSILVNAIMDNDALWTDDALDRLVDRVMNLLTSRLIK